MASCALLQVYWQPINVLLIPEKTNSFLIAVRLQGCKTLCIALKQASLLSPGQGCCSRRGGGC